MWQDVEADMLQVRCKPGLLQFSTTNLKTKQDVMKHFS